MKYLLFLITGSLCLSINGQVQLSEMQSSNSSTIADEWGEFDDWIEIHNPTANVIDIGGLVLKDQVDTWTIPITNAATLVAPGGYFLLWADDQEMQGMFHTNFKLASGGEFLGLYESDGVTPIDTLTIPALQENHSYIRCADGWEQSNSPTPIQSNECSTSIGQIKEGDNLLDVYVRDGGIIVIDAMAHSKNLLNFQLYSIDGKKVLDKTLGQKRTEFRPQTSGPGIYFVIVNNQNFVLSRKIWLE